MMDRNDLNSTTPLAPRTQVIHGDEGIEQIPDVGPPLHLTSTFAAVSGEEFAEMANVPRHPRFYTRYGNPTMARAEAILAELEGAESALLTASGMGAISTTVLTLVSQGEHVVAQHHHYMGTSKLLGDMLPRFGIDVTVVDQTRPSHFADAIQSNTRLIIVETPANPTLQLTDLAEIASLAKEHGALTMADNTFASPMNQRPIDHGIDLVVHSGTKYLGGHHDLLAGVVMGSKTLIERVWESSIVLGATAGAFDSWLLLRGLRTLPIRMRQHNETAQVVAEFLECLPDVEAVHYPGLPSHSQSDLARRQMTGYGGVMSFEVAGGYERTRRFTQELRLIRQAASLGGFETLAIHAAAMWEGTLGEEGAKAAGVQPNLVRLSIGLEDPEDLKADLRRAFERST